jgi:collagenase-like PrtC family protease
MADRHRGVDPPRRRPAYVTLNTLVFEPELPVVEELIHRVAAAGVDAIIVQDPAVAAAAHEQFGVTRGTMRTLAVLR